MKSLNVTFYIVPHNQAACVVVLQKKLSLFFTELITEYFVVMY